jgi:hypothetical protein
MLALCSERIALVSVTSFGDSVISPYDSERHIRYAVDRALLGKGPSLGTFALRVSKRDPPPLRGDKMLVMWWLRIPDSNPPETIRFVDAFNLSHPARAPWNPALTNDFRVVRSPDSILAIVSKRVGLIRAGHPLGDDRRYRLREFAAGHGCIEEPMPLKSEAQLETNGLSENSLVYPADADRLPELLDASRAPRAEMRAWAANALAQYPCASSVVARLEAMLLDDGRSLMLHYRTGGSADSAWVPIVRDAARTALDAIQAKRVRQRRP